MTHWRFPFQIDATGRTATADQVTYVKELIELVLFTAPGERVRRPDFGSGLHQLIFEGQREELATATQFLVSGALQRWLGDLIQVEEVTVTMADATLAVTVRYLLLASGLLSRRWSKARARWYAPILPSTVSTLSKSTTTL